jgi:hypothetical protein
MKEQSFVSVFCFLCVVFHDICMSLCEVHVYCDT